jgi:hypothetical protein
VFKKFALSLYFLLYLLGLYPLWLIVYPVPTLVLCLDTLGRCSEALAVVYYSSIIGLPYWLFLSVIGLIYKENIHKYIRILSHCISNIFAIGFVISFIADY